jgi:hypothetical protein
VLVQIVGYINREIRNYVWYAPGLGDILRTTPPYLESLVDDPCMNCHICLYDHYHPEGAELMRRSSMQKGVTNRYY